MARLRKVRFPNGAGELLAGALSLPAAAPRGFVLFAHCFTCGKDIPAAARIARALADQGFAVLRFDFTGLGDSAGDFAATTFSSNVRDLIAAADYLREHHQAPVLLIGHSLGGTAAVCAAPSIEECRGVAAVAAPASPAHIERHLAADRARLEAAGETAVEIAGRTFTLSRGFFEDLHRHPVSERITNLTRPLLIFHSPADSVVDIGEAEALFESARHPKSFIALDGADHMLSRAADARYVAVMTAGWLQRYLPKTQ